MIGMAKGQLKGTPTGQTEDHLNIKIVTVTDLNIVHTKEIHENFLI